jgi:PAS domain S-box-containing protein
MSVAQPSNRVAKAIGAPSSSIPGNIHGALDNLGVPAYALDSTGIIRWLNPAAIAVMGDVRGRQHSSVVAPEQARAARDSFTRKLLGTERSTNTEVVLVGPDGKRIAAEVSSVSLLDGGRFVGVFGVIPRRDDRPAPEPHPHLTPRQNEVLHLIAAGHSTAQIADELGISLETTRNHIRHILRALDAHSRVEALAVAHRDGILRTG